LAQKKNPKKGRNAKETNVEYQGHSDLLIRINPIHNTKIGASVEALSVSVTSCM
jgi:hypothetical protein